MVNHNILNNIAFVADEVLALAERVDASGRARERRAQVQKLLRGIGDTSGTYDIVLFVCLVAAIPLAINIFCEWDRARKGLPMKTAGRFLLRVSVSVGVIVGVFVAAVFTIHSIPFLGLSPSSWYWIGEMSLWGAVSSGIIAGVIGIVWYSECLPRIIERGKNENGQPEGEKIEQK